MSNKIFVGGLPWSTSEAELEDLFAARGTVISAKIISDRDTGRSKGFGFVEMANADEASTAINELNGSEVGGRNIVVNEARERAPRNDSRW